MPKKIFVCAVGPRRHHRPFIGDSQTRSVFYDLLNKLSGKLSGADRFANSKILTEMTYRKDDIAVRFIADPYLRQPDRWYRIQKAANVSISALIIGLGQWPAAGRLSYLGNWPDAIYRQWIMEKVAEIRSFWSRNPHVLVVWLGIPCYPHPMIRHKGFGDPRRNRDRLFHMDQFALRRMQDAGIPTVSWFSMTESMTHTANDGAHYANFVREAAGNVLVHELCRKWGKLRK